MSIYRCELCNYKSKDKPNYNKHCKTKKHLKRIKEFEQNSDDSSDEYFSLHTESTSSTQKSTKSTSKKSKLGCQYCGKRLSRIDSVKRHEVKCLENPDNKNEQKTEKTTTKKVNQDNNISTTKLTTHLDALKCGACEQIFTRKSSLTRHKKSCTALKIQEKLDKVVMENDLQIVELKTKNEVNLVKKELEMKDKLVEELQRENEYLQNMLEMAGNAMYQTTMSAINHANTYYTDAKPLEKISVNEVKKIAYENILAREKENRIKYIKYADSYTDNSDDTLDSDYSDQSDIDEESIKDPDTVRDKIMSDILFQYRHKNLPRYIGDIIVQLYKKECPFKQQLWATDVNRLTYVIRQLLYGKESKWIVDKGGKYILEYLIQPVMDELKNLSIEYRENYTSPNIRKVLNVNKLSTELVIDIDSNKLGKNILKAISPHLHLGKNQKVKKVKKLKNKGNK